VGNGQEEGEVLGESLTVREVCELWGHCRAAVRYHIDRGNFKWRYMLDNRILVERASVIRLRG